MQRLQVPGRTTRPVLLLMPALLSAALAAAGLLWQADALAQAGAAEPAMRDALTLLREHRHADAFGRIAALADRGDAGAALLALAMLQNGQALYGSEWSATPGQLRRWTALVAREARLLAQRSVAFERIE